MFGSKLRKLRHEYDQLIAAHHNLRDAYHALRAQRTSDGELSDEDRALLEEPATELVGCLVSVNEEPLLTDAEDVSRATIPAPIIEIVYPDRLVTLMLAVEHYGAEEVRA